ncbi:MAG: trypsin-like peptidase domain-containing protein [Pseudomonadota bacterium]
MKSLRLISKNRKQAIQTIAIGTLMILGLVFSSRSVMADNEPATVRMVPESFSALAEGKSAAVINVRTEKNITGGGRVFRHFSRNPFGNNHPGDDLLERFFGGMPNRDFKQRSLGSGFIIGKDGYIVTNNHVIENADQIKVSLKDGKEYDATIIGRDPSTDIALIKIKPENDLPVLTLGSSDKIKVGEWVIAIGSPFGLAHTVTAGIVSAKGRVIGSGPYDDFIQTDASINPGNSGGPLLDMKGMVVGINTAIVAGGQGIGFAIPIDLARGIIEQLKGKGSVTRGWLGVGIQNLTEEIADYYGVDNQTGAMIMEVFPGDPADKAGIQARDIIIAVNGQPVTSSHDLTGIIANIGVGEKVDIKVLRKGEEKTFTVVISKREENLAADGRVNPSRNELGIMVSKITPEISRQFKVESSKGVIVTGVEPGSEGEKAGVAAGDIILEVNRNAVDSVKAYGTEIRKVKKGEMIQLFIKRAGSGFMVVKIKKE